MTGGSAFGAAAASCPCCSGRPYGVCCAPLHHGQEAATTAEQLMRSRYSAFAVGDVAYLLRTWHPRTRPEDVGLDPSRRWTRLEILRTERGSARDVDGLVEFRAHHCAVDAVAGAGVQHEVSRFAREGGRWLYVEALP